MMAYMTAATSAMGRPRASIQAALVRHPSSDLDACAHCETTMPISIATIIFVCFFIQFLSDEDRAVVETVKVRRGRWSVVVSRVRDCSFG